MKKQLAELIKEAKEKHIYSEEIAQYLIERGVVVLPCEVIRCTECVHAVPLDRNCELNTNVYMHCTLLRGDLTQYVWHKYKKYYKSYSIVEHDDFCSYGERKEIK